MKICALFVIFFTATFVAAQKDILILFEKGMALLKDEQFEAAEEQFRMILEKDHKSPEAYYGLGVLYSQRNPGSETAEKYLRKAIKLKRNYARAYYQLALVYQEMPYRLFDARESLEIAVRKDPTLVDAWFELGKVQEKLWPFVGVVNIYRSGVKKAPEAKILFEHFVNAGLWHENEKKVLSTINDLIEEYPDNPDYRYAMAEVYHILEDYDKSLAILERIQKGFPEFSHCKSDLLYAKVYFDMGEIEKGIKRYFSALNSIRDSADTEAVFKDVSYIMNDEEFEELRTIPLQKTGDFYRRFWRSRDPNLATVENERIPEFYKRLSHARRKHLGYLAGYKRLDPKYAKLHPYAPFNVQGEQLLSEAYLPKALDRARDLDDMGLIYVRHGPPDQVIVSWNGIPDWVTEITLEQEMRKNIRTSIIVPRPSEGENLMTSGYFENLPLNLTWRYKTRDDRPEMIFHFKKYENKTQWIIEALPYAVANRELLSREYQQLANESFSIFPNTAVVSDLCKNLVQENKQYVKIAMQTETTDYRYGEKEFPVSVHLITFKGEDDKNLLEMYYGINGRDVTPENTEGKNFLNVERFASFCDESWNEIIRFNRQDKIALNMSTAQWKRSAFLDVERFSLPPGRYHYEIQIRDNTANRLAVFKGKYAIRDYGQNDLILSDILLTGAINDSDQPGKFRKENITYRPHLFLDFQKEEVVGAYFELYNLAVDSLGKTNFRVTCSLHSDITSGKSSPQKVSGFFKSIMSKNAGIVDTVYVHSGSMSDEKIYFYFDAGELDRGSYDLIIDARDLNAMSGANRKVEFTMKPRDSSRGM